MSANPCSAHQYREGEFQPGDLVTRDDTDVHRVVRTMPHDLIEVVCVRAPRDGWCKIGDTAINLADRYDHVGGQIDGALSCGLLAPHM